MDDLAAARAGDPRAFERLVAPHRRELLVHAYRMLGSTPDAEDVVQEALLAAWRGLDGLRDAAALRSWLYRITTNAGIRLGEKRGPRLLSWDASAATDPRAELASFIEGQVWVEPLHDPDPEAQALRREHISLAWIAAMQHLPASQRAALILKDVLGFSSAETARMLELSVAAVNSALQRARASLAQRRPRPGSSVPDDSDRGLVERFVASFTAGDVDDIVELLAEDVRFTMPPLPAWFDGRADVEIFLRERVFATRWRVTAVADVNGCPAAIGEQEWDGVWRPGALMLLHTEGGVITWLATFVDPDVVERWLPEDFVTDR
jgi:RNA polymerase sigma-70 factor (TIGR02960 family)